MNRIAYRTTGLAIKTLSNLSKARVYLHDTENIPEGAKIFVVNHFTRLETFLLPYYLHRQIKQPIWSLASSEFFVGALGRYLESVGAVSTSAPDRDRLIIKSLLTNSAGWVIFPEGRMVKNKKIFEKGRYIVSYAGGKHPPHTGAAYLALRTEFYRQRLLRLSLDASGESERLLSKFNLGGMEDVCRHGTHLVPVYVTYFPLRARINILNKLAARLREDLPERLTEELMTEGAMLISGVDIDIRFGKPIDIGPHLQAPAIRQDMHRAAPFDLDDPLPCLKCMRRAALNITQLYMGAIYGMTTVNHDHIFASLLKHGPTDKQCIGDYRRRAFLAVQKTGNRESLHLHKSLQEDQKHLLIDDRFEKLADFLTVAQEKGVLAVVPPYLIRNRKKLRGLFDFHRSRIDNPIAVIANEIEPLTRLQKKISRLCWLPPFWLRFKVRQFFLRKAMADFEEDYHRFYSQAESKPRHIGQPYLVRGRGRRVGIVLSHGYLSAPEEVRPLADHLGRKGYSVYVPRLKGHGTTPDDLAQCSFQDWIESVEEGYLVIRNLCDRVFLGGFSTGAALALELAARVGDLTGVFAISTPLRLQYLSSRFAPIMDTWNRFMDRVHLDEAKKEFVENKPENPHINYHRNPISGGRELERLMDYLEPRLARITVPALVVQSQEDPVVNPKGSERIFQLLGSRDKQYLAFNFNRHGIVRGQGSERVHEAVAQFIRHALTEAPVPPPSEPEKESDKDQ
jgi:esterase/lipase/1-acyl-sn-glycerol-3-phosphate acyltransferase